MSLKVVFILFCVAAYIFVWFCTTVYALRYFRRPVRKTSHWGDGYTGPYMEDLAEAVWFAMLCGLCWPVSLMGFAALHLVEGYPREAPSEDRV